MPRQRHPGRRHRRDHARHAAAGPPEPGRDRSHRRRGPRRRAQRRRTSIRSPRSRKASCFTTCWRTAAIRTCSPARCGSPAARGSTTTSRALQAVIDRHDILRTAVHWEGLPEPVQVVWRHAPLAVEEVGEPPTRGRASRADRGATGSTSGRRRCCAWSSRAIRPARAGSRVQLSHHLVGDNTSADVCSQHEIEAHLLGRAAALPAPVPLRSFVAEARLGVPRDEHEAYFRDAARRRRRDDGAVRARRRAGRRPRRRRGPPRAARPRSRPGCASARARSASARPACAMSPVPRSWRALRAATTSCSAPCCSAACRAAPAPTACSACSSTPCRSASASATHGVDDCVRHTQAQLARLLRHEHAPLALAQRRERGERAGPAVHRAVQLSPRRRRDAEPRDPSAVGRHRVPRRRGAHQLPADAVGGRSRATGFWLTAQVQAPIDPRRVCAMMHTALDGLVDALERAPATPIRRLEVLPADERRRSWSRGTRPTRRIRDDRCVHRCSRRRSRASPDAIAVVDDAPRADLPRAQRARQPARPSPARPRRAPRRAGRRSALERSAEMVVGLLAILKAGGAYVPLDPAYPPSGWRSCSTTAPPRAAQRTATVDRARAALRDAVPIVDLADPAALGRRRRRDPGAARRSPPATSPTSSTPPAPPASPRASWSSTARSAGSARSNDG